MPPLEVGPVGSPMFASGQRVHQSRTFAGSRLAWRHEEVIRAGGTHDFGEYQPHITIAYGDAPDLASIVPYRGVIKLGPEIFAEVDENWKAKVLA